MTTRRESIDVSPFLLIFIVLLLALAGAVGCNFNSKDADPNACSNIQLTSGAGSTGTGQIFSLDPMISSGNPNLSPQSLQLDSFTHQVTLQHLGGHGVLEGSYVDVRSGLQCNNWYGASDAKNQFVYQHADPHFQEVMAYQYGDAFRASLDAAGSLAPNYPVQVIAHCEQEDNAFYWRGGDGSQEYVCLGDSVATPGASYADDGSVVTHELQHATTMHSYSDQFNLGGFFYDEAGALNEAISDFMSLIHTDSYVSSPFDPRTFSRWALGTFIPGSSGIRGAHKCPTYDSTFPNCTNYPSFSAANNTISYVYPDGLSWPYANNFSSPGYARSAFRTYTAQEEIHNAGVLLVGALWDVYEALGSDRQLASKLVVEAIRHLPKPSLQHQSPVSFRALATQIVNAATLLNLSSSQKTAISDALTARGLLGGASLASDWAAVGPGLSPNAGLRVEDDPNLLKPWLAALGGDPSVITQGLSTGLNKRLDPGDVVAVWFDIQNNSTTTAGGVEVTVTSMDPDVQILDGGTNIGAISATQAQIYYHKINGTSIVSALQSTNPTYNVPTGNSYFQTDLFYGRDARAAIWMKVKPTAPHNKPVVLHVDALPTNGSVSSVDFTVMIN